METYKSLFRFFAETRQRLRQFLTEVAEIARNHWSELLEDLGQPLVQCLLAMKDDLEMSAAPLGSDSTDAASSWKPEEFVNRLCELESSETLSPVQVGARLLKLSRVFARQYPDQEMELRQALLQCQLIPDDLQQTVSGKRSHGPTCTSPTTVPIVEATADAPSCPSTKDKLVIQELLENPKGILELSTARTSNKPPIITSPISSSKYS